ncbi:MAG TPA: ATP-binding protein [Opitutus sp.]|nr:ATP-binding protein [Opitutus sp.]
MPEAPHTLTLRNDVAEIPRLADAIDEYCAPLAPSPKDLMSLHLVVEELVTNVIKHGYADGQPHTFTVTLSTSGRAVTAVIDDDAPAYDPLARPEVDTTLPLDQRPIGGLGVHLVKKLTQTARYERRNGHNLLTVTCAFAPAA